MILDHIEGVEPTDVTGQFYSSGPGIVRKRQLMRAWTEWCVEWTAEAIAEDRSLLDGKVMGAEIRWRRYKTKAPAEGRGSE